MISANPSLLMSAANNPEEDDPVAPSVYGWSSKGEPQKRTV